MSGLAINNYKFHLAMYSSLLLANNPQATANDILDLNISDFSVPFLNDCYGTISEIYTAGSGPYYASKERQVVTSLLTRLQERTFQDE